MMSDPKEQSANYSLRKNVWRTLRLYWQIDRFSLVSYLLLIAVQVTSSILTLFFGSRIIGELTKVVQNQPVSNPHVYLLLGASTVAILCERFAWRWLTFIERKTWIKWYVRITVDFNNAVSGLDMGQHHDHDFEKRLQKVQQEYSYTPQNFANYILQCLHSVVRLVSTLVVVATFAPWLIIIMTASLVPGFLAEKRFSKLKWNLWGEKGDKPLLAHRTTQYLQDKNKLQETKIFGTRDYLVKFLEGLHKDFYNRQLKHLRNTQGRMFAGLTTEVLVAGAVTLWLIQKVLNHSLSLANYSFYSGIILQFGSSLSLIANSLNFIYDNNEYMKDLYWLFDVKPLLPRADNPLKLSAKDTPTITFENVSFKYPSSEKYALKNVSLTIKPGDSFAFVGENGAGKTTIIKLLLRFYDPDEGRILVDGTDVREVDLSSYYTHIGVLFQNFNDYPFSVRDNIALGRVEDFNDNKRVHEAAQIANAEPFIEQYPKKYEQVLEVGFKDGIEPSGGQWQRIALARALFRDAGILILDEPTAAVDAKSEYEIFKTLETHSKDKTTIIISHRFSTVRRAETIYVMRNGEVIEQGSHTKLMKNKDGLYKEMFDKQAEGYR
jgi:ABC-type multidrug transport system fused ATPase/permease subunit